MLQRVSDAWSPIPARQREMSLVPLSRVPIPHPSIHPAARKAGSQSCPSGFRQGTDSLMLLLLLQGPPARLCPQVSVKQEQRGSWG